LLHRILFFGPATGLSQTRPCTWVEPHASFTLASGHSRDDQSADAVRSLFGGCNNVSAWTKFDRTTTAWGERMIRGESCETRADRICHFFWKTRRADFRFRF
jgi:hypothetical protein